MPSAWVTVITIININIAKGTNSVRIAHRYIGHPSSFSSYYLLLNVISIQLNFSYTLSGIVLLAVFNLMRNDLAIMVTFCIPIQLFLL